MHVAVRVQLALVEVVAQQCYVGVTVRSLVLVKQADCMADLVGHRGGAAALGRNIDPLLASEHADIGAAVAGRDPRKAHEVGFRGAFDERDDGLVVPFRDCSENGLPLLVRDVAVNGVGNAAERPAKLNVTRRRLASHGPGRCRQHGPSRTVQCGADGIGSAQDHVASVDCHPVDHYVMQFQTPEQGGAGRIRRGEGNCA